MIMGIEEKKLAGQLDLVITELTNRMRITTARESGLTGIQFFILRHIADKQKLTITDLACTLGVTLSAITGLVNRLVNMGLAEREQDNDDKRVVWVKVTAKGLDVINQANKSRAKDLQYFLKHLPPKTQASLPEFCQTMGRVLDINTLRK
jgi:DNA-binding MarR family transcriptional regulator